MQIGQISAAGAGAIPHGIHLGTTLTSTGGVISEPGVTSASSGTVRGPTTLANQLESIPDGFKQLAGMLEGFSTAEILLTLMLMSAASQKDDTDSSGSLGLLAGMAIASQLGSSMMGQFDTSYATQGTASVQAGTGQQLNMTA